MNWAAYGRNRVAVAMDPRGLQPWCNWWQRRIQTLCRLLQAARSKVGRDCWDCACGIAAFGDVFVPTEGIYIPGPPGWAIGGIGMAE